MLDMRYGNFHPTALLQTFCLLGYLTFPKTNFPFRFLADFFLSQCQNYNNHQYLYIHWSYMITTLKVSLSDIFPQQYDSIQLFLSDRLHYLLKLTSVLQYGRGDHLEERQVKGMSLAREKSFVFIPILRMTIMLEQYGSRVNS